MLNEVNAVFGGRRETETAPLYQYDYGQRLVVYGPSLPDSYEVHFSNGDTYSKRVYLGVNDTPENWHEIPDGEVTAND